MLHIYIPSGYSTPKIKELLAIETSLPIQFGLSWEDFLNEVPDHSTVVVYSVDFFPSLMELLATLAQLQERAITLKSIQEPWLSEPVSSTTDFLIRLRELAFTLHATQTKRGLQKARTAGKTIGRPRKTVAG